MQQDALQRIAHLIMEDPSITVRQIAQKMGYSEEKSVYYWLEKSRYYGIKAFKRAVLTGEFAHSRRTPKGQAIMDRAVSLVPEGLPFARNFTSEGKPVVSTARAQYSKTLGEGVYAWILEDTDYIPLLWPNDVLFIDPEPEISDGDLVLLIRDSRPELRFAYGGGLFVHPLRHQETTRENPHISGKIIYLIRGF